MLHSLIQHDQETKTTKTQKKKRWMFEPIVHFSHWLFQRKLLLERLHRWVMHFSHVFSFYEWISVKWPSGEAEAPPPAERTLWLAGSNSAAHKYPAAVATLEKISGEESHKSTFPQGVGVFRQESASCSAAGKSETVTFFVTGNK